MRDFYICFPNGRVEIGKHEGVKNLWPVGTLYIDKEYLDYYQEVKNGWPYWMRKNSPVNHSQALGFKPETLMPAHRAFFMLLGITKLGYE